MIVHAIMPLLVNKLEARFVALVDMSGGPEACWLWTGDVGARRGYGRLNVGGRRLHAHKLAFVIFHRREPVGQVQHRCDCRACVNPSHLVEGDARGNKVWETAARRHVFGARVAGAKLDDEKARAIVAKVRAGTSQEAVAVEFGVSRAAVSDIIRGRTWQLATRIVRSRARPSIALTRAKVVDAQRLRAEGRTQPEIAAALGISLRLVRETEHIVLREAKP